MVIMKLLFAADLHVSDPMSGVFDEVIAWVGHVMRDERPDVVVFGGDLLQCDNAAALGKLIVALPRVGEWFWLAGNRDPHIAAMATVGQGVKDYLLVERGGMRLLLLDTENVAATRAGLAASGDGPLVALGHRLPWRMEESIDEALAASDGSNRMLVGGHQHEVIDEEHAGWRCVGARGLDPARTKYGGPQLLLLDDGHMRRIDMPARRLFASPRRRVTFGIAPTAPVEDAIRRAIEHQIPAVQLTYRTLSDEPTDEQLRLIEQWRAACPGAFLSIHLRNPDPMLDDPFAPLMPGLRMAQATHVADLTAHLPRIDAAEFFDGDATRRDHMVRFYVELARRAARTDSRLSVENIHNTIEHAHGGVPDLLSTRPHDMRWFIDAVRRGGATNIGMIFDVGHARNNGTVSNTTAPSDWIAQLGDLIQTLHVHQVGQDDDGLPCNHQPITSPHQPIINYEGISACLHSTDGPDCHAFVEVRDLDGAVASWHVLQQIGRGQEMS
jgi:predicted phosphodiesterase